MFDVILGLESYVKIVMWWLTVTLRYDIYSKFQSLCRL